MIGTLRSACVRTGGIDLETVEDIDQMLWTKFVTVSAFSGATSLMRARMLAGSFPIPMPESSWNNCRDEGMAVASAAGHAMQDGYKEFAMLRALGKSSHPRHARRWPTTSPVVSRSSFHGYRDACTCSGTNLGCRRLGIRRSIARCICTPMALSLRGNSVRAGRKLSGRQEST